MPRVFHDPVAEPRCAAGGRSSNIIISSVRRERPSSKKEATSASTAARFRRRVQVGPIAGRSADRARMPRRPIARSHAGPHRLAFEIVVCAGRGLYL